MLASRPLRLLMVCARFYPEMGGTETHIYEVGRRLAAQNVQVTVLTTRPNASVPASEMVEGMTVVRVPAFPAGSDLRIAPRLMTFIQQGNWDIVHCQGIHTFVPILAMRAARQARIPYIVTFHTGGHSNWLRNRIRDIQWRILAPLLRDAQALIGVSQFEARLFQHYLGVAPEKLSVIPNGGKLPEIPADRLEVAHTPRILSVGRLEKYKGHQRIIAAMPYILAHMPDMRLEIVGSGSYRSHLEAQIHALGLQQQISIGAIPPEAREEMALKLHSASLVTLLSDYEAHPIAVLEALALGRPVLVTATSGLQELADKGYARSVPLASPPKLIARNALQQLRHPLLPDAVHFPTWEECVEQLMGVYHLDGQGAR